MTNDSKPISPISIYKGYNKLLASCIIGIIGLIFSSSQCYSQEDSEYYEISVFLEVNRFGGAEIPSIMSDRTVYLSVIDVFDFLQIKNIPSIYFDTISGFIIEEKNIYLINRFTNTINYKGKVHKLKQGDLLRTETNLYLDLKYFGSIFGLDGVFDFRSLKVTLNTLLELPVIKKLRLETMRNSIRQIASEKEADTTISRNYPLFNFGMLDWSVNSAQSINNMTNTRVNVGLGAIVAGGETNVVLNYNSGQPFTEKQLYYLWRLANNDFRYVKQIMAGKINTYATSSIYNPVIGVQITNTPTTIRRSFGTYTLNDYTQPGWTVELYVNNVLIDYVQTDASGFFSFEVPLVYGNTQVTLRYYGPFGEERFQEQNINVPFSFLPKNEIDYRVSAGIVEDSTLSKYSRGEINYGLGRHMTIGGGVEYLSSVTSGSTMPFVNTTISLAGKLLFSGNYTYGVKGGGVLNYRLSSGMQFDAEYTKYDKEQKAINYNYLEVRKLSVTAPIKGSKFSLYTRLSLSQYVLPSTQYTNAELMLSANLYGVNANFTTFANISKRRSPYINSTLSLGYNFPKNLQVRTMFQYDFSRGSLISAKCELEKRIHKIAYVSVSYEENLWSNIRNFQVGVRFDLNFANASFYSRFGNQYTSFFETVNGSLRFDTKTGYVKATNRSGVGRGGLIILPYLDINNNGSYDKNEKKVYGLDVRVSGGRISQNENDTTIIISELEPYANCFIEMDISKFDNIAWKIKYKTINVAVNPNQLRVIEIPVSVNAEASGMIYKKTNNKTHGQGRILINFYDEQGKLVVHTLSEDDGYFNYLGLSPGNYIVKVDPKQLEKLKMTVSPDGIPITITPSEDGDIVDDLDFVIIENGLK